jgi:hypothetical protein
LRLEHLRDFYQQLWFAHPAPKMYAEKLLKQDFAGRGGFMMTGGLKDVRLMTLQARSQDRLQGGISFASIDGADKEVSERQGCHCCRSTSSRAAKFGYRYAAADSLWQQGGRSKARRPLSLRWMVCPTRS